MKKFQYLAIADAMLAVPATVVFANEPVENVSP
jgi:hypothetical protein